MGVDSRARLAAVWAEDPRFLLAELSLWVRKGQRQVLLQLWPLLLQEAAAGALAGGAARTGQAGGAPLKRKAKKLRKAAG